MEIGALALRIILLLLISYFKLEETVTPSNFREDAEIPGGI
jgi:hypothetical protein